MKLATLLYTVNVVWMLWWNDTMAVTVWFWLRGVKDILTRAAVLLALKSLGNISAEDKTKNNSSNSNK